MTGFFDKLKHRAGLTGAVLFLYSLILPGLSPYP